MTTLDLQASARRRRLHSRRLPDILITAMLAALTIGISIIGINRAPAISPVDEITHIDYAWRIMNGSIPHRGDPLTSWTLTEWSCHGETALRTVMPKCGSSHVSDFQNIDTENWNAWQPPLYFAYIALMTKLALTFVHADPVNVMRLFSGLLVALGVMASYGTMRLWGARKEVAVGACLLILSQPYIQTQAITVSDDAPVLLVGAASACLAWLVVKNRKSAWIVAFAIAALTAAVKTITLSPVIVTCMMLCICCIRWHRRHDPRARTALVAVLAAAVGALIITGLWAHFVTTHTPSGWKSTTLGVNNRPYVGLPFAEWLPTLLAGYGFQSQVYLEQQMTTYVGTAISALSALIWIATPTSGMMRLRGQKTLLTSVALIGPFMAILFVQIQGALREHVYFPAPTGRYAVSFISVTAIVLACTIDTLPRRVRWLFVAAAIVLAGATTLSLLGFTTIPSS